MDKLFQAIVLGTIWFAFSCNPPPESLVLEDGAKAEDIQVFVSPQLQPSTTSVERYLIAASAKEVGEKAVANVCSKNSEQCIPLTWSGYSKEGFDIFAAFLNPADILKTYVFKIGEKTREVTFSDQKKSEESSTTAKIPQEYNFKLYLRGQNSSPNDLSSIAKGYKYIILDFSADWCGYCIKYANSSFGQAVNQLKDNKTCAIHAVVAGSEELSWTNKVPASVSGNTVYLPNTENHGRLLSKFGGKGYPYTVMLDTTTGQIVERHTGNVSVKPMLDKCGS